MKTKLFIFLFFLGIISSEAQQLPSIGLFTSSQLFYNAGYAGAGDKVRGSLIHRRQWSEISGSPNSTVFTLDLPIGSKLGTGLMVSVVDEKGLTLTNIQANFSYRIYVDEEAYFQAGLNAGVYMGSITAKDYFQWQENDPVKDQLLQAKTGTYFRLGAGLYFKHPVFFAGISSPDIVTAGSSLLFRSGVEYSVQSKKLDADDENNNGSTTDSIYSYSYTDNSGATTIFPNLVVTAGAKFNLTEYVAMVPFAFFRYYKDQPVVLTANIAAELNQTIMFGAGYGPGFSTGQNTGVRHMIALFGTVGLSPKIKVGYRYENNLDSKLGPLSTHEIMLSYGIR